MSKMVTRSKRLPVMVGAGLALATLGAMPASGVGSSLAMLDRLEPGLWELRARDPGTKAQRLCIRQGQDLIQLRHGGLDCKRVVVVDHPAEVAVQYTCPGNGYGRTSIRRETDTLIQLDSQGIENGRPFAFAAEGRRIGTCRG